MENQHPNWPNNRNLARYNELTGIDIAGELAGGDVWIDVGAGKTAKPMAEMTGKNLKLVAVGAHRMDLPDGIEEVSARIPESSSVMSAFQRRARLVTDVFGAVSYSPNPADVLIYEALLLKPGARAVVFTQADKLGSCGTWDNIRYFFAEYLNQSIEFSLVENFADANKRCELGLRIHIKANSQEILECYDQLFERSRKEIGAPKIGMTLWRSKDDLVEIKRVDYEK